MLETYEAVTGNGLHQDYLYKKKTQLHHEVLHILKNVASEKDPPRVSVPDSAGNHRRREPLGNRLRRGRGVLKLRHEDTQGTPCSLRPRSSFVTADALRSPRREFPKVDGITYTAAERGC